MLGQVIGQTALRPGWYRPVGSARAGSGAAMRFAPIAAATACAQQGGTWNVRLRRCTGLGFRGLEAFEGIDVGTLALGVVLGIIAAKYMK